MDEERKEPLAASLPAILNWSSIGPYVAETAVLHELSKRNLYGVRLPPQFDFDIFTNNGARIEVKSSRLRTSQGRPLWGFSLAFGRERKKGSEIIQADGERSVSTRTWIRKERFGRRRDCDFYVLVGFDAKGETICDFFIVPESILGDRMQVGASPADADNGTRIQLVHPYRNRWDLLVDWRSEVARRLQAGG